MFALINWFKTDILHKTFFPHDFIIKTSEYASLGVIIIISVDIEILQKPPRACQIVRCEPCRQDLASLLLPETSQSMIYILGDKHT